MVLCGERAKTSDHETVTGHSVYDVHCNTYVHAPVDVIGKVTYSSWNFSAALVARNSLVNSISAYLWSVRGVLVMNMCEDVRLIFKSKWLKSVTREPSISLLHLSHPLDCPFALFSKNLMFVTSPNPASFTASIRS